MAAALGFMGRIAGKASEVGLDGYAIFQKQTAKEICGELSDVVAGRVDFGLVGSYRRNGCCYIYLITQMSPPRTEGLQ